MIIRNISFLIFLITAIISAKNFFTVVLIPDTQWYTWPRYQEPPSEKNIAKGKIRMGITKGNKYLTGKEVFHGLLNWIVERRDSLNIKFVTHVGDLVQTSNKYESEWIIASEAMAILDSAGIPWNIATGNHDHGNRLLDGGNTGLKYYNKYFPTSRFDKNDWYGGSCSEHNTKNYQLFSGGPGLDYIIFHSGSGKDPCGVSENYQWMDNVLKEHPNRRMILTNHRTLYSWKPETTYEAPHGGKYGLGRIWKTTKFAERYDQMFLNLSGHSKDRNRQYTKHGDRIVEYIMNGTHYAGTVGWLTFFPDRDTVEVYSYSTVNKEFHTDVVSQFSFRHVMNGKTTTQSKAYQRIFKNMKSKNPDKSWYTIFGQKMNANVKQKRQSVQPKY